MQLHSQYHNSYAKGKELSLIPNSLEKFIMAREKIIKQLPNMYSNTRLSKYLIQNSPIVHMIGYGKVRGLVLNVQKRFMWYGGFETIEEAKALLFSLNSRNATRDLNDEDMRKYCFNMYVKIIFEHNDQKQFITIPLVDLNLIVI